MMRPCSLAGKCVVLDSQHTQTRTRTERVRKAALQPPVLILCTVCVCVLAHAGDSLSAREYVDAPACLPPAACAIECVCVCVCV